MSNYYLNQTQPVLSSVFTVSAIASLVTSYCPSPLVGRTSMERAGLIRLGGVSLLGVGLSGRVGMELEAVRISSTDTAGLFPGKIIIN